MTYIDQASKDLNDILSKDRGLVKEEIVNGVKIKLVSYESQDTYTVIEYEDGENAEFFSTYGSAILYYEMLKKKYEEHGSTI